MASSARVVLVTGCSSGIGKSSAILLAKNGFKVYATMRNLEKKEALLEEGMKWLGNSLFIEQLDVCSDESVEQLFKKIIDKEGKIDVLVNNAGVGSMCPLEAQSMKTWREIMEVNFFGVLRTTKAVLPVMKKNSRGHLINISSQVGLEGVPFYAVYSASKFAVEGLSESLASELSLFGVNVSLIEPGPVSTGIQTPFFNASLDAGNMDILDEKTKDLLAYRIEKRKNAVVLDSLYQTPEDIAQFVLKALMADLPHFRYQTNPLSAEMNAKKFNDVTGDTDIQLMTSRIFKDKL